MSTRALKKSSTSECRNRNSNDESSSNDQQQPEQQPAVLKTNDKQTMSNKQTNWNGITQNFIHFIHIFSVLIIIIIRFQLNGLCQNSIIFKAKVKNHHQY